MTTDAELNELCALLPTLPDREPWLDLKFHAWEVLRYSREVLELLPGLKRLWELGTEPKALCEGLSRIDFLLMYPVVRGVRLVVALAGQSQPPSTSPSPLSMELVDQAFAPSEVRDCRSRMVVREKLAVHLAALEPAIHQAHAAVVRALSAQGSPEAVLEQVRSEFSAAQELLQGVAARHARAAYDWADQAWRLSDPDGREARFDRLRAMFRAGQASAPVADSARV